MNAEEMKGPQLLDAYLEREGLSYVQFAARDASGRLGRILIGRLLKGARISRVSVNVAMAIRRASLEEIPIEAWETPYRRKRRAKGPIIEQIAPASEAPSSRRKPSVRRAPPVRTSPPSHAQTGTGS